VKIQQLQSDPLTCAVFSKTKRCRKLALPSGFVDKSSGENMRRNQADRRLWSMPDGKDE
jgi:hypothetical protein